jgi:acyl-CoA thioester hydrolase
VTEATGPTHAVDLVVRFSDLDPLGHLNNVAVVRMLETGRVEFSHDQALMTGDGIGFVLAALNVSYRAQAFYRDALRLETGVARIGRTSFTLTQRLWRLADEATVAEGESVLVVLGEDRVTPAPVPDAWRVRLLPDA